MTITIIAGPPCAGKSTYAAEQRDDDDLVVDFDDIATALGSTSPHDPPDGIAAAAHRARFAAIARALEGDGSAWIIETSPTDERVTLYADAGATFVLLDPGEDVCLERADDDDRPAGTADVIRAWYEDPPDLPDSTTTISDVTRNRPFAARREGAAMSRTTPLGASTEEQHSRPWFRVEASARPRALESPSSADVYIYDAIGGWFGVEASEFVTTIAALDVDEINLYVNSPGGDVYDAIAITNALRRHRATVAATVDGLAASAASFIITAADTITMAPNSEIMVHDAWGFAMGNAAEMRDYAERLDSISDNIASMYARQAGGDTADWRAIMLAETWYSAEEAVSAGLADRVEGDETDAEAANSFDLSVFAHAGRRAAPEPITPAALAGIRRRAAAANISPDVIEERIAAQMIERRNTRPAEPGSTTPTHNRTEVGPVTDTLIQAISNRLGIPASAAPLDEAGVLAALDEVLAEGAHDAPTVTATTRDLPEGVVMIDSTQLASLQEQAAAGAAARAEQITDRRQALVNAAIDDGRIAPASQEHWMSALAADEEGMSAVLAALAPGLVPLQAKSTSGGVDASSDEGDALYNKVFGTTAATTTPKES